MEIPKRLLITDIGSTTTKSILFEYSNDGYSLLDSAISPTTVEAPHEDVTIGLIESAKKLGNSLGINIVENDSLSIGKTIDAFLATSSAGGGLQILVTGLTTHVTAKSAYKAASVAGGIILDVLAVDDGRTHHQQLIAIGELRPDILLISGGLDGGNITNVAQMAYLLSKANLKPKFMPGLKMPVVYAGNIKARDIIHALLDQKTDLKMIENLRPTFDRENIDPTREAIHELFIQNVMSRAPGYPKVLEWADSKIMPTPTAVERLLKILSVKKGYNTIIFDIGGATTDVFSQVDGEYMRTVCANLGMSYSASNVLIESGTDNIMRWLSIDISERELRNRILNKSIYPTRIPENEIDIEIEHALAREAIRMALEHHLKYATKVSSLGFWDKLRYFLTSSGRTKGFNEETTLKMRDVDLIFGSGGVLSKAPSLWQSAQILIDAAQPKGITYLAVDSIFMAPHLGMMSMLSEELAYDCFERECFVPLGTCVSFEGNIRPGKPVASVTIHSTSNPQSFNLICGEIKIVEYPTGSEVEVEIKPAMRVDAGEGMGVSIRKSLKGGKVGLIFDSRGRPIAIPNEPDARLKATSEWKNSFKEVSI